MSTVKDLEHYISELEKVISIGELIEKLTTNKEFKKVILEEFMVNECAVSSNFLDLELTKALTKSRKFDETAPDIDAALGFNVMSASMRDEMAEDDPRYNLGSQYYDPSLDPARNPNLNI